MVRPSFRCFGQLSPQKSHHPGHRASTRIQLHYWNWIANCAELIDLMLLWLSEMKLLKAFGLFIAVWSKIKTVGKTGVIPSRHSLAACRPLRFFGAINGALCGSADKWGETHGVGTYPGLHHGDGGPGAAAAE